EADLNVLILWVDSPDNSFILYLWFECRCFTEALSSLSTCTIDFAFASDSGQYWCEDRTGRRSSSVHVTSPTHPVTEGEAVTLRCRNKTSPKLRNIVFYKDNVIVKRNSTENLTIHRVSKSDEGRYKCSISGLGQSPETWLRVTDFSIKKTFPIYISIFSVTFKRC
uniref:Ig-like domain-containing protein n=1 Tax=Sphaeramia orbicularis TaxID=375764 RepID=A0A672ZCB4_9TELE